MLQVINHSRDDDCHALPNLQEFDLAHREQAPERQLAALRGLESQPGASAANLLRAAAICDRTPQMNKS